jgi:hypothetical protein
MSEEVNPKTFDLASVLAGVAYPETTVDVYFNNDLAYQIATLSDELDKLSVAGGKEYDAAQKKFDKFIDEVKQHKFTFHIKGVPAHVENSIVEKIRNDYPSKKNAFGVVEGDNDDADKAYVKLVMQAYISKIVAPDGSVIASPSADDIDTLFNNAPQHVLSTIQDAIVRLKTKTSAGFEIGVKSADFLSKP